MFNALTNVINANKGTKLYKHTITPNGITTPDGNRPLTFERCIIISTNPQLINTIELLYNAMRGTNSNVVKYDIVAQRDSFAGFSVFAGEGDGFFVFVRANTNFSCPNVFNAGTVSDTVTEI